MLPFARLTFEFQNADDPVKRLNNVLVLEKWSRIKHNISSDKVILEHKLPFYFHNSWNPIFQGSFKSKNGKNFLVGCFRVNWFALVLILFFIGYSGFSLLQTYFSPDSIPGRVAGWREDRLSFDLSFFCMAIGINVVGWLIGVPNQKRIMAAIHEST